MSFRWSISVFLCEVYIMKLHMGGTISENLDVELMYMLAVNFIAGHY